MFSILERIPDAVSFLSRFSLSILSPFPDDLLNLVRRRVALRVPLPLQRLILLLNRFRRLLAQAHSVRDVSPDQVSCAVGGQEDFEQVAMVPPLRVVNALRQVFVLIGESLDGVPEFFDFRVEVALPLLFRRGVAAGSGGAAHEQPFVYGIPQNLGRLPSCLFANLYYLVIVFRILAE